MTPGMRLKGGVLFDPDANGWYAIVHTWENRECSGPPTELRSRQFPTEEEAMLYYKTEIGPQLKRKLDQIAKLGQT